MPRTGIKNVVKARHIVMRFFINSLFVGGLLCVENCFV